LLGREFRRLKKLKFLEGDEIDALAKLTSALGNVIKVERTLLQDEKKAAQSLPDDVLKGIVGDQTTPARDEKSGDEDLPDDE
jgi:hypothetical protein